MTADPLSDFFTRAERQLKDKQEAQQQQKQPGKLSQRGSNQETVPSYGEQVLGEWDQKYLALKVKRSLQVPRNLVHPNRFSFVRAPLPRLTAPPEPDSHSFATQLRHESGMIATGELRGAVLLGYVMDSYKDQMYVDFGGKFHCVLSPTKEQSCFVRGAWVVLRLLEHEHVRRFLGSEQGLSLHEANAMLIRLHRKPMYIEESGLRLLPLLELDPEQNEDGAGGTSTGTLEEEEELDIDEELSLEDDGADYGEEEQLLTKKDSLYPEKKIYKYYKKYKPIEDR